MFKILWMRRQESKISIGHGYNNARSVLPTAVVPITSLPWQPETLVSFLLFFFPN